MAGHHLTSDEFHYYENQIAGLRVNEIQTILGYFRQNKLGKKNELIHRCVTLLRNSAYQNQMVHQIREVCKRSQRSMGAYAPSSHHSSAATTHHQNGYPGSYATPLYGGHMTNGMQNGYRGQLAYAGGGSTMGSVQTVQMQSRPVNFSGFRPIILPFYEYQVPVLQPMELPSNPGGMKQQAKLVFNFQVPSAYASSLRYQSDRKELPRNELQLRFFHLNPDGPMPVEFHDDFPPQCVVKIDDTPVTLPNIIPTNKPNVEAKRPSRPVNITPYCQPPREQGYHKLVIEWTSDKRIWAVLVNVVHRINSDILKNKAINSPVYHKSADETKALIMRRLSGDDDEGIQMDQLKISLLCPLSRTRMQLPARGRDCSHLQCFDLDSYLKMNEKKPTWKCAVCSAYCPFSKLIIDKYFERMVHAVDPSISEVELLKDGSYRIIKEDILDLSDSDDEIHRPPRPVGSGAGAAPQTETAVGSRSKTSIEEIVLLDSDDEEETALNRAVRESLKSNTAALRASSATPSTAPGSNSTAGGQGLPNGFHGISPPSITSFDASTPSVASSIPSTSTLPHHSPSQGSATSRRPKSGCSKVIECITLDDDDSRLESPESPCPEKDSEPAAKRKRAATSSLSDDMSIESLTPRENGNGMIINDQYQQQQSIHQESNNGAMASSSSTSITSSDRNGGPLSSKSTNLKTALDELLGDSNSPSDQGGMDDSLQTQQMGAYHVPASAAHPSIMHHQFPQQQQPASAPYDFPGGANNQHTMRSSTPASAPVHTGSGTAFPMPGNFRFQEAAAAVQQQHQQVPVVSSTSAYGMQAAPAPISRTMSAGIQGMHYQAGGMTQQQQQQQYYGHVMSPWNAYPQVFASTFLPGMSQGQQMTVSQPQSPVVSSPGPMGNNFIGSRQPQVLNSPQAFGHLFFPGQQIMYMPPNSGPQQQHPYR